MTSRPTIRPLTAALLGCAVVLGSGTTAVAAPVAPYVAVQAVEVPSGVAVADDGTIAAALHDARRVSLISPSGTVRTAALSCSPSDVAIDPGARYAWAVCQDAAYLSVIDVATGSVGVATYGLVQSNVLAYVPARQQLYIADAAGLTVVSVSGANDYEVLKRISLSGLWATKMSPSPDGARAFVATDAGRVRVVNVDAGTVTALAQFPEAAIVDSLALSTLGTVLYVSAAIGPIGGELRPVLMAVDPSSGRVVQTRDVIYSPPSFTTMHLSAGHRTLYFSTGLGVTVDGVPTGEIGVPLDNRGRLGGPDSLLTTPAAYGAAVARSAEGSRIALGDTVGMVKGLLVDDSAYPPSVSAKGQWGKGRLTVSGATTGLAAGAQVRVYVKNLSAKRPRFILQPTVARIGSFGSYRWTAPVTARTLAAYVTVGGVRSPVVTLG